MECCRWRCPLCKMMFRLVGCSVEGCEQEGHVNLLNNSPRLLAGVAAAAPRPPAEGGP